MSHIIGAVVQTPRTLTEYKYSDSCQYKLIFTKTRVNFTIAQPILADSSKTSRLGVKEKLGSSYWRYILVTPLTEKLMTHMKSLFFS
jgi:hypothetical protein